MLFCVLCVFVVVVVWMVKASELDMKELFVVFRGACLCGACCVMWLFAILCIV